MPTYDKRPTSSFAVLGWGLVGLLLGLVLLLSGSASDAGGLDVAAAAVLVISAVPVVIGGAAVGTRMGIREHEWQTKKDTAAAG